MRSDSIEMTREPKETALAMLALHANRTRHPRRQHAARILGITWGGSGCMHSGDGHERQKTVCGSPERADVLLEWLGV
ncbi:conserved protein of unknown function [Burkholderia multivorans]